MTLFEKRMDLPKILDLRKSQYVQNLYIEGIVPAGGTLPVPLPLSKIGAFLVLSFTGTYTSLRIKVAGVSLEDLGVCPLRMKIQAGASSMEMFGDYVPMNLLLTPGRVRVDPTDPALVTGGYVLAAADLGPVPNQLFYPYSYQFPFEANDTITVTVKNDFDTAANGWSNRFSLSFLGIRARDLGKALKEPSRPSTPVRPVLPSRKI
jgi:hypothetical protein